MHKRDKVFMHRCIDLAQKGLGNTYPNPLVGCVLVKNNEIIAEDWHKKAGAAHAEVNANLQQLSHYFLQEHIPPKGLGRCFPVLFWPNQYIGA